MSQQTQTSRTIGNVSILNDANTNLNNSMFNAIIGAGAALKNTIGIENTVVGSHALENSVGGSQLCVVGSYAAPQLISGSGAIFLGDRAAPLIQSADDSIFVGFQAGKNTVQSSGCVMIGSHTGSISRSNIVKDVLCVGSHSSVQGTGSIVVGTSSTSEGYAGICVGYCNLNYGSLGIVIGAHSCNSSSNSIVIGNNICNDVMSSDGSLTIVAGTGQGNLNLHNTLTGSRDARTGQHKIILQNKTGTITLDALAGTSVNHKLSCDALASPLITVLSPDKTTPAFWKISLLSSPNGCVSDLALTSSNGTQVTFCDDFVPSVLNFTAQHRCVLTKDESEGNHACVSLPGTLLVATGKYCGLDGSRIPTIDESIPIVTQSKRARDPRVFGVLSSYELNQSQDRRMFRVGSLGFSIPTHDAKCVSRVIVNSGGEGGIRVCGANGTIKNGDLLVSSDVPGVAMNQGDDIVRSSTIGKATCDCDVVGLEETLIGCTYMC